MNKESIAVEICYLCRCSGDSSVDITKKLLTFLKSECPTLDLSLDSVTEEKILSAIKSYRRNIVSLEILANTVIKLTKSKVEPTAGLKSNEYTIGDICKEDNLPLFDLTSNWISCSGQSISASQQPRLYSYIQSDVPKFEAYVYSFYVLLGLVGYYMIYKFIETKDASGSIWFDLPKIEHYFIKCNDEK